MRGEERRRATAWQDIHRALSGCVLQENWTSARGRAEGKSFNQCDRVAGAWRQTWVDNGGGQLRLEGRFVDGRMVLEGDTVGADGKRLRNRITWTPLEDGRVRQLWEASSDSGANWSVSFDGYYERAMSP